MKNRIFFIAWLSMRISTLRVLKSVFLLFATFELSSSRFRVKLTRFRWQESVRPFCRLARSEGGETDTGCTHQPLSIALSLTLSAPPVFFFMFFAYVIAIPWQKTSSTKATLLGSVENMHVIFHVVAHKHLNTLQSNLFTFSY